MFSEKKTNGYIIYVMNPEYCPVSVRFDFVLTNLLFSEDKKLFVVPAQTEKYKIGELTVDKSGSYKFNFNYQTTLGDVTLASFDQSFLYDLPFQKGKNFRVFQGYNGSFSHQNENALDFTMPEGTEVTAAREGKVVKVVQSNTQSCPTEDCAQYNNSVTIMHPDGTFATYAHIKI